MERFQEKCGVRLANLSLLETALTHPTFVFEHPRAGAQDNQRLEFLGDAVLGMVTAHYLYETFPCRGEGELTKLRAVLVCEATLARKAEELGLGEYLLLGRGEETSGGYHRPSTLADAFESVVAAIYLDAGLEAARDFIMRQLGPEVERMASEQDYGDYKTRLQEKVQQHFDTNVQYEIIREWGPDHEKHFAAAVKFREQVLATGEGRSKKEAEQQAARKALAIFRPENIP